MNSIARRRLILIASNTNRQKRPPSLRPPLQPSLQPTLSPFNPFSTACFFCGDGGFEAYLDNSCLHVGRAESQYPLLPLALLAGPTGVLPQAHGRGIQGRRRQTHQARVPSTLLSMQTLEAARIPNYQQVAHSTEKHKDRYSNIHACTRSPMQISTIASNWTRWATSISTPATCGRCSTGRSSPSSRRRQWKIRLNTSGQPAIIIRSGRSSCSAHLRIHTEGYGWSHAATS